MQKMSKEEFIEILSRQQRSGLTIKDFCINEAYTESSVSTHCMALVPTSNLFYLCVELKNRQQ